MRRIIAFLLAAFLLVAAFFTLSCSDKPNQQQNLKVTLGEPFTLNLFQTAEFTDADLLVAFQTIELDTRPCEACYQYAPGIARVWFTVQSNGDHDSLFLSISGDTSEQNLKQMTVEKMGYEFSLRELWPEQYRLPIQFDKAATPPVPPGAATLIVSPATQIDSVGGTVAVVDAEPQTLQLAQFDLDSVSVTDNLLAIDLTYSGGCRPHYFWAFMTPSTFAEGTPREANIYIRHSDYDPCRAVITDRIYFNLSTVKEAYFSEFGTVEPIKLNIFNYFESQPGEKLTVQYDPSD